MKRLLLLLLVGCGAPSTAPEPDPVSEFPVRVIYLLPSDQERFAEVERAIVPVVAEVRTWYLAKTGRTFKALALEVIQAKEDYLTMKCGDDAEARKTDEMPHWVASIERAVGGWRARTATLVFAQGGGGVAQANLQGDFAGWCVVGDWVIEPISGRANPKGIPAALCPRKIYVTGGTPIGTIVHELGHAFGLHHPDGYETSRRSIMRAHWDYPETGFLDHEKLVLSTSPFTAKQDWDSAAPVVDYLTSDVAEWGGTLEVAGRGFKEGDEVDFIDVAGSHRVKPLSVAPEKMTVTVPRVGPGVIRVVRWTVKSNAVPVNLYEKRPR